MDSTDPDVWLYVEIRDDGVTSRWDLRLSHVFHGRLDARALGDSRHGEPTHDDALGCVWLAEHAMAYAVPAWFENGRNAIMELLAKEAN